MGRKSLKKKRKKLTPRVNQWLAELLIQLQNEDLQSLSIDDIAKIAGRSKSTIYEYFESKEEIIDAACKTRIELLTNQILKKELHTKEPIAHYGYFMEIFSNGISDISISFLQNIKEHYPAAWDTIDGFTDSFIILLKEIYHEGMKKGQFTPVSIELLTHFDKYFVTQVVTNLALFQDDKYKLSDLVKEYLKLRLDGLVKR